MLWSCEFVARFIKYTCQTSVIVIPYHYNGKINKNDTMHFVRGTAICNRRTLFLSRFRCVLLDGLLQDFIAVLFYCGRYSTYRDPILGRHYFDTTAKQLVIGVKTVLQISLCEYEDLESRIVLLENWSWKSVALSNIVEGEGVIRSATPKSWVIKVM
jgi:hypothetical protein